MVKTVVQYDQLTALSVGQNGVPLDGCHRHKWRAGETHGDTRGAQETSAEIIFSGPVEDGTDINEGKCRPMLDGYRRKRDGVHIMVTWWIHGS